MADTSSGASIRIRGAREHNLKNVDLELARDRLIVFTGLSGSGKSSLAFDTIYAEGQRRYVESLSAYARQFLGQMDKPDVDFIEGLSPAISIDQKSASRNPRSTVGTITEIYDYLRLLYARIGIPHCPNCGRVITRQTPQQIVDRVLAAAGRHALPGARARRPGPQGRVRRAARGARGRRASRVPGSTVRCATSPTSSRSSATNSTRSRSSSTVSCAGAGIERRLTDSLETALKLAEGVAEVEIVPQDENGNADTENETLTFSEHLACNHCGLSFDELAPRNFSFNSPYGACERCDGLGTTLRGRPRARRPRRRSVDRRKARSRRGPGSGADTSTACSRPSPTSTASTSTRRGRRLRQKDKQVGALRHGPARGARAIPQPVRAAALVPRPGSRASSRGSSAGTPKRRATARASRSRVTCARSRAPRVRARG